MYVKATWLWIIYQKNNFSRLISSKNTWFANLSRPPKSCTESLTCRGYMRCTLISTFLYRNMDVQLFGKETGRGRKNGNDIASPSVMNGLNNFSASDGKIKKFSQDLENVKWRVRESFLKSEFKWEKIMYLVRWINVKACTTRISGCCMVLVDTEEICQGSYILQIPNIHLLWDSVI